jgi:hypothetical protein
MRSADGRLKIVDFGLARIEPADAANGADGEPGLTRPGAVIGTPAYLSPEQISGEATSPATDVFAFGVLMYEYACGQHPFAAPNELAQAARALESSPEPLDGHRPQLPPVLVAAIARCLQKRPGRRFASGTELAAALEASAAAPPERGAAPTGSPIWWRAHQLAVMALYVIACAAAWGVKESFAGFASLWIFIVVGGAAALGGIIRGHLIFTEIANRPRLAQERQRTEPLVRGVDLGIALVLAADALAIVAFSRPLWAVLITALALGIALASLLMEPATTAAAFEVET